MEEENIKVAIRIRPIQRVEIKEGDVACVKPGIDGKEVQVKVGPLDAHVYRCNRCFPNDTSQMTFFNECGITSLLDSAIKGYRTCAFAFGQTGAGKTYTMFGYPKSVSNISSREKQNGLVPRSLEYLFTNLATTNFSIKLSCTEILNEHVFDLFSNEKERTPLVVREHVTEGFFLEGCNIIECLNYDMAIRTLDIAVKNRQIGSHELNSRSSRSHCLIEIHIEVPVSDDVIADNYVNDEEQQSYFSKGKISLVDLAGSERLKSTKSTGKVLQEAGFINKSLYVLGKVIAGLVRTNGDVNHKDVPYRDSKLTKLLISSLDGRSRTLLISCVSEAKTSQAETLRTLKFSMSCARIRNKPLKFLDPQQKLILDLKDEIKRLRFENRKLRTNILTAPASGEKIQLYSELQGETDYRSTEHRIYSAHSILSKKKNPSKFKTKNGGKIYGIQKLSPIKNHKVTKRELFGDEVMSIMAENDDTSTASILSSNSLMSKRSGHYGPSAAEMDDLLRRGGPGPMIFKKKRNGNQSSSSVITISPIRETSLVEIPPAQTLMKSMETMLEKIEKRLDRVEKSSKQSNNTQSMPLISSNQDNNYESEKKVKKKKKKTVSDMEGQVDIDSILKGKPKNQKISPYIAHLVKNKVPVNKEPKHNTGKPSNILQISATETKLSEEKSKPKSLNDSIEDELEALGLGPLKSSSSVISKPNNHKVSNHDNHRIVKSKSKSASNSNLVLPTITQVTEKNEVKMKSNKYSDIVVAKKQVEKLPYIMKTEEIIPVINPSKISQEEVVLVEEPSIIHDNETEEDYDDDFDPIEVGDVHDLVMTSPTQKEHLKTKLTVLEKSLAVEREIMEDNPGDVTAKDEEQFEKMTKEVISIRKTLNIAEQICNIDKAYIESPEPTPKAVKNIALQLTELNQEDKIPVPIRQKTPQTKNDDSHSQEDDGYADDYEDFEEQENEEKVNETPKDSNEFISPVSTDVLYKHSSYTNKSSESSSKALFGDDKSNLVDNNLDDEINVNNTEQALRLVDSLQDNIKTSEKSSIRSEEDQKIVENHSTSEPESHEPFSFSPNNNKKNDILSSDAPLLSPQVLDFDDKHERLDLVDNKIHTDLSGKINKGANKSNHHEPEDTSYDLEFEDYDLDFET